MSLVMNGSLRLFQYVPAAQESVVGTVIARSGENWRVDIGAAHMANLDGLAFEGATKRNRPNLKVRSKPIQELCLMDRLVAGGLASVRTRLFGAQRHGARAGMFRCSVKES
jgi:exosome complex component RRP40